MLSISQVTNAGAAGSYYQSDNYYAKDEGNGVWYGGAAITLGIDGQPVDPDRFVKVLSGEMENGQILGRIVDDKRKHIAGYDMTFSAPNYHEADVVRFNKAYRKLGVFAGETLHIKSIDKNGVVYLSKNGSTIAFKPSRDARASGAVEAFKITPMEIHAGDQIRWRRKEYQYGIENMQRGKIEAIYKDNVTIKMQDGRSIDFAKDHPHLSFLSHAWAQTGHAYQGQTIDHIIAVMPSLSGLTTQKGFYTAISRARHEVTLSHAATHSR